MPQAPAGRSNIWLWTRLIWSLLVAGWQFLSARRAKAAEKAAATQAATLGAQLNALGQVARALTYLREAKAYLHGGSHRSAAQLLDQAALLIAGLSTSARRHARLRPAEWNRLQSEVRRIADGLGVAGAMTPQQRSPLLDAVTKHGDRMEMMMAALTAPWNSRMPLPNDLLDRLRASATKLRWHKTVRDDEVVAPSKDYTISLAINPYIETFSAGHDIKSPVTIQLLLPAGLVAAEYEVKPDEAIYAGLRAIFDQARESAITPDEMIRDLIAGLPA